MIDPTPADDNALLIAVIFEDFEIDHTPDGWPAVKQMHLSAAAVELRRQHAEIDRLTDAYCGAREDLAIWKRRALEAEEKLRAESAVSSRLVSELNAENGPTHMGEPARQSQPLTPLTPGQCVDIADVAAKMEFSDNFLSDICKIVEMVEVAHGIGEKP